jgi:hypothetical protein
MLAPVGTEEQHVVILKGGDAVKSDGRWRTANDGAESS